MKKLLIVLTILSLTAVACSKETAEETPESTGAADETAEFEITTEETSKNTIADDTSELEETFIQTIASSAMKEDELVADEQSAQCFAQKIVQGIGAGRLAELGFDTEEEEPLNQLELSREEDLILGRAMTSCFDIKGLMISSWIEEGLSEADATCLVDFIDIDIVANTVTSEGQSPTPEEQEAIEAYGLAITEAATKCGIDQF